MRTLYAMGTEQLCGLHAGIVKGNLHGLRLSVRKQNVTASHAVLCLHRMAKQVDIFLMQNSN